MKVYRQGDVLIVEQDAIMLNVGLGDELEPRGSVLLAEGEATGHAHVVRGDVEVVVRPDRDGLPEVLRDQVRVKAGGAVLEHDEHGPIVLPPGMYRVQRQRQFVPERSSMAELVRD